MKYLFSTYKTDTYSRPIIKDKPFHNKNDKSLKIEKSKDWKLISLVKVTGTYNQNIYIDTYEI